MSAPKENTSPNIETNEIVQVGMSAFEGRKYAEGRREHPENSFQQGETGKLISREEWMGQCSQRGNEVSQETRSDSWKLKSILAWSRDCLGEHT